MEGLLEERLDGASELSLEESSTNGVGATVTFVDEKVGEAEGDFGLSIIPLAEYESDREYE